MQDTNVYPHSLSLQEHENRVTLLAGLNNSLTAYRSSTTLLLLQYRSKIKYLVESDLSSNQNI